MHIAASNPLAIDKDGIDKSIVNKELEIIKAEITNSGKPAEMAEKISKGKISKFLNDNSLLNQLWIMDPKKKVSDILKENSLDKEIKILQFIKYKFAAHFLNSFTNFIFNKLKFFNLLNIKLVKEFKK